MGQQYPVPFVGLRAAVGVLVSAIETAQEQAAYIGRQLLKIGMRRRYYCILRAMFALYK